MCISVQRTVHQTRSPRLHNFRDDIRPERLDQGIDLSGRREAILEGDPGRHDGPLLLGRIIDQSLNEFLNSIVDRKRCTTPRVGGLEPPCQNEAIPECQMSEECGGGPRRVDHPGELLIREGAEDPQPIQRFAIPILDRGPSVRPHRHRTYTGGSVPPVTVLLSWGSW